MCHQASDLTGDWGSVPWGALGLPGRGGASLQGSPPRARELGSSSPTSTTSEALPRATIPSTSGLLRGEQRSFQKPEKA